MYICFILPHVCRQYILMSMDQWCFCYYGQMDDCKYTLVDELMQNG